ncbi:MAG: prepilin peptidase, partial [bacterium]
MIELGWGGWVLAFVLGTMVGSFLNVVIYRVPRGESI